MQSRDHNDCRHQQDSQCKCTDQILIICHLLCKYNRFVRFTVESMEQSCRTECCKCHRTRQQCISIPVPDQKCRHGCCTDRYSSTAILSKKSFVRIDSFNGLGFSSITALECGSSPSAIAGRLSVSRLIKVNAPVQTEQEVQKLTQPVLPGSPRNFLIIKTEWQI